MQTDEKMMAAIHGPFIDQRLVFAPGATNLGVEDDLGMREKDIEIEGAILEFVAEGRAFDKGLGKHGINRFEVDKRLIYRVDEVLRRIEGVIKIIKGDH